MNNDYRIVPDLSTINGDSKCNNCQKTIYWNDSVRHRETGRKLPLEEPWTVERPPVRHKCMERGQTKQYLKKYSGDTVIDKVNYYKELYDFLKKIHWSKKVY